MENGKISHDSSMSDANKKRRKKLGNCLMMVVWMMQIKKDKKIG